MNRMSPLVAQLYQHTHAHRVRMLLQSVLASSVVGAWVGGVAMLCLALTVQLMMVSQRVVWYGALVGTTAIIWGGVWWWRQRRAPSIWRQLDRAYAWSSSVTTAVDYATMHAQYPLAAPQYRQTLAIIAATSANQLSLGWRHIWQGWVVWLVVGICALLMPTPFDAQLATQAQVQQIAQTLATQLRALPPVTTSAAALQQATQIATAKDAEQLFAELDVAEQQLTNNQQQVQRLDAFLAALQQTPDAAQAADVLTQAAAQLPADMSAALADAQARAQAGDPEAYQQLEAQIVRQQQVQAAWQNALAQAKQRTQHVEQASQTNTAPPVPSGQSAAPGTTAPNAQGATGQPGGTAQSGNTEHQSSSGSASSASGTAGNGSGGSGGTNASQVTLFVPQLDAAAVVTLSAQTSNASANGDETLTSGGGLAPAPVQYTYADVVDRASQRATQAMADAHVSWAAQQTVSDYFAVLQEQAP